MKKKIIGGLFVFLVLMILFSLNIQASLVATIGMKGLSFASPETAQMVQTVMGITQPTAWAGGYVTQQVTGEAMQLIAEESPQTAQVIQQYNRVKGWIDEGAEITEELKMTENAELAGGSITISDKEQDVSSLVNSELEEGSIKVSSMEVSSKREGEDVTLTAKKGGYVEINGKRYENLKEGSFIKIGRDGSITEADLTATKAGTYELGGKPIKVEKDTRIVYEDGVLSIYGEGKTVELEGQSIKLGEKGISMYDQTIIGDFTSGEIHFEGEVTLDEKGFILGANTKAESPDLEITTSEEGEVLFSKGCQDVSGFTNYVNPCRGTLTMEGEGFTVQPKGEKFGVSIKEKDVLKFDMDGGKVILEDGLADISLKQQGTSVKVTNGDIITTHKLTEEGIKVEVDPDSVGKDSDVELTTATKGSSCTIETNPEGIVSYHCPIGTSSPAAGGAITDTTGMAEEGFLSGCLKKVSIGKNYVTEKLGLGPKRQIVVGKSQYSEGRVLYPDTITKEPVKIESDCERCVYYRIKGQDEYGEDVNYIISIDDRGVSGYFEEGEGNTLGPSVDIFQDYEEKALGLKTPIFTEEEIGTEFTPPRGELEYYHGGVWYMKDGTVWQAQPDGTVQCMNCRR